MSDDKEPAKYVSISFGKLREEMVADVQRIMGDKKRTRSVVEWAVRWIRVAGRNERGSVIPGMDAWDRLRKIISK